MAKKEHDMDEVTASVEATPTRPTVEDGLKWEVWHKPSNTVVAMFAYGDWAQEWAKNHYNGEYAIRQVRPRPARAKGGKR